jgi:hypothetical protein
LKKSRTPGKRARNARTTATRPASWRAFRLCLGDKVVRIEGVEEERAPALVPEGLHDAFGEERGPGWLRLVDDDAVKRRILAEAPCLGQVGGVGARRMHFAYAHIGEPGGRGGCRCRTELRGLEHDGVERRQLIERRRSAIKECDAGSGRGRQRGQEQEERDEAFPQSG